MSRWAVILFCLCLVGVPADAHAQRTRVLQGVLRFLTRAAAATSVVAVAATNVQKAQAATLDVRKKQLEIDALTGKGERVVVVVAVSEADMKTLIDEGRVTVELEGGAKQELLLTVRR